GFRTSHEAAKVEPLPHKVLRSMIDDDLVRAHRVRGLTPDRPTIRGTAQNPDMYFQAREAANPFYLACPAIVQGAMNRLPGGPPRLWRCGARPSGWRAAGFVGSRGGAAVELGAAHRAEGEPVGLVKVRLFRPFSAEHLRAALPATVKAIAVLDRTKEPGSLGE